MGAEPWATVQVRLAAPPEGHAHAEDPTRARSSATWSPDAATIERLDALGTLLAAEDAIGGVERRDAGTLADAPWPEQWIYTTPPAVEAVLARVHALASTLSLTVQTHVEIHADDDWRESWKQFYRPQVFGEGDSALLLRPSWVPREPEDPPREVVIDPGRAFGTGLHESTRLCLRRLCSMHAEGWRPETILDLGAGSGILGLAAARLWPQARVLGVDFDPEAVETMRENTADNRLEDRVQCIEGTLADVHDILYALVIANIRPRVLEPIAAALRARVAPAGRALLSGILVEEAAALQRVYEAVGLRAADEAPGDGGLVDGEWQALELRAPP